MKDQHGEEMTIAGQPAEVYCEVALERRRQDRQWGEQNHPLVPGRVQPAYHRARHQISADDWKARNSMRVELGGLAWDGILLEEVHEAFAEGDPKKVRAEMVQVAAVAIAIIEAIDRSGQ